MLSIEGVVTAVLVLIVAAIIFGLLWWAVGAVAGQLGGAGSEPFIRVARVILILGAVFVCIAVLMSLIGHPIVRW